MTASSSALSPRARAWNNGLTACPGPLDLVIPADRVEGEIPAALRGGRMFSNGPGWTRIGERTAHPFDGHGYVRSMRLLQDGGVRLQAAFVQTPTFLAEQKAGRLLRRGLATHPSSTWWRNIGFGPARNVANTTISRFGHRLLAGWEGGCPFALDPESLATLGEETFGGLVEGQAVLAHMRQDKRRGRLVLCSPRPGPKTQFTFRELDAQERLVSTSSATIRGMSFAHDFAFTDDWYVLGGNPLSIDPFRFVGSLIGTHTLLDTIRMNASAPGQLHLVPRGRAGPLRTITLDDPALVVHFGNAFQRGDDVIVDACVFQNFEFGAEFGYSGPDRPFDPALPDARKPQRLVRITIPAGAETAQVVPLCAHGVDFPRFHPAHEGQETPWLFGATRDDTRYSDPFDSVIAIDLRDPARPPDLFRAPDLHFVGEPLFAPDPEDPAQGYVLVLVTDGLSAETKLVVLDAVRIAAGPLAVVPLPLLPIAFHGDFEAPQA